MTEHMTREGFKAFLSDLGQSYRIFGPIRRPGKGAFSETDVVDYGLITDADHIVWAEKSFFSPKAVIYPIRETLFHFVHQQAVVPDIDLRPILLLLRPCDLAGIDRLDAIFLQNGELADFYYQRRRDLVRFAVMACDKGFDSCFCAVMGTNKPTADQFDYAIIPQGDAFTVITTAAATGTAATPVTTAAQAMPLPPLAPEHNVLAFQLPDFTGISLEQIFNHPLWLEYSRRCIACGRCNTSCITCSCFTMQDVYTDDNKQLAERRRRWAGCHVDGFSDMAGGHTFRSKNGERMRFKLMHKIYDFHRRFGKHMCVGCGRCTDVCPEYISFPNTIKKVTAIIEEVKANGQ